MTNKYPLPPLPQGEYRLSPDSRAPALYDEEAMEAYALSAIEADRKRRGVNSTRTLGELECNHCGGTGDVSGEYPGIACPDCAGTGKAPQPAETFTHRCANCDAVYQGHGCPRCRLAAPQPLSESDIPAEPVKSTCKKCNGTGVESTRFHGVWPNGEECLEPIRCDQCDGFGTASAAEPVLYTSQEALDLISRSDAVVSVGLTRVPQMSWNVPLYTAPQPAEPVKKKDWNVELSSWSDKDFVQVFHERPDLADRLRRVLAEPVKVPSDSAIMFEWSQTPNTGDMRVDLIAFARALLARYGQPVEPVKSCLTVKYDDKGDCLYVYCDNNEPTEAEENEQGILLWRAYSDGRLVGVTIPNFMGPMSSR